MANEFSAVTHPVLIGPGEAGQRIGRRGRTNRARSCAVSFCPLTGKATPRAQPDRGSSYPTWPRHWIYITPGLMPRWSRAPPVRADVLASARGGRDVAVRGLRQRQAAPKRTAQMPTVKCLSRLAAGLNPRPS